MTNLLGKAILEAYGIKPKTWHGPALSLLGGIGAGVLKEANDAQPGGTGWDWKDFGATVAGAVPAAGIRFTHRF